MMSLISMSQTVTKLTDADVFAKIFFCVFLMVVYMILKGEDERNISAAFHYLAGLLYIFTKCSIWNKDDAEYQEQIEDAQPKKEMKKKVKLDGMDRADSELLGQLDDEEKCEKLEAKTVSCENLEQTKVLIEKLDEKRLFKNLPPVLDDKKKKSSKKNKRSSKKINSKENKEPTIVKEKTKMYDSINTCQVLNRTPKEIYDELYKFILTEQEMRLNYYPSEDMTPRNLVPPNCDLRVCARCGIQFEVFNGIYVSTTKCLYHPKKAIFEPRSQMKTYPCCNKTSSEEGCTQFKYHVTVQHGPKTLTKTASRRHVRRDLQHRIFSLDCEMSYTTSGLEVTRVGLVDIDGLTVYDSYVKPKSEILDYNTQYSGVEKRHLDHVTITLDDVNKILSTIIHEDTILVGHALNNDLAALGLIHKTVVDTSVLYANERKPWNKKSLKSLAADFLDLSIQNESSGHNCIEDARASLRLALLKVPPNPPSQSKSPITKFVPEKPLTENIDFSYELEQQQTLADVQNFVYPTLTIPCDFFQHPELKKYLYFNPPLCGYYNPYPAFMKRCV